MPSLALIQLALACCCLALPHEFSPVNLGFVKRGHGKYSSRSTLRAGPHLQSREPQGLRGEVKGPYALGAHLHGDEQLTPASWGTPGQNSQEVFFDIGGFAMISDGYDPSKSSTASRVRGRWTGAGLPGGRTGPVVSDVIEIGGMKIEGDILVCEKNCDRGFIGLGPILEIDQPFRLGVDDTAGTVHSFMHSLLPKLAEKLFSIYYDEDDPDDIIDTDVTGTIDFGWVDDTKHTEDFVWVDVTQNQSIYWQMESAAWQVVSDDRPGASGKTDFNIVLDTGAEWAQVLPDIHDAYVAKLEGVEPYPGTGGVRARCDKPWPDLVLTMAGGTQLTIFGKHMEFWKDPRDKKCVSRLIPVPDHIGAFNGGSGGGLVWGIPFLKGYQTVFKYDDVRTPGEVRGSKVGFSPR